MRLYKDQKGSTLVMALIFSFVVMATIAALLYSAKIGLLTTRSIVKQETREFFGETYLNQNINNIDFTTTNEHSVVGHIYKVEVDDSKMESFFHENNNAELYQSEEYYSYLSLFKGYDLKDELEFSRKIIFNKLATNSYLKYDEEYTPINVPLLNVANITDANEVKYRLNDDKKIDDEEKGYIGYIKKKKDTLSFNTSSGSNDITAPKDLSEKYKVLLGWNLEDGRWYIFIALYDSEKIFITSTSLRNLMDDPLETTTDLEKWDQVISDPDGFEKVKNRILKDNILQAVWYYDQPDEAPSLLVSRKNEKTKMGSSKKSKSVSELEFYNVKYDTRKQKYEASFLDSLSFRNREIKEETTYMLVPDLQANLNASTAILFYPYDSSPELTSVSDFNYSGDYKIGRGLSTYIAAKEFGKPSIVSKNQADKGYITVYDKDTVHQYEYTAGLANLKDKKDKTYFGEKISMVVPKFGYNFVFTNKKVHQNDFKLNEIRAIDVEGDVLAPQFLMGLDKGDSANYGKVYISPNGLKQKAAATLEEQPSEEGDIASENKKEDKEDDSFGNIYLDIRDLYPLGVVRIFSN
ncbi:hypothetical protein ACFPDQ_08785 [Pseudofrancisella aestuarii]|uniref:Pilus assembly protein n=1 Tax=Pseudofrancisella aestuarii TaxID=2670347 RepID=A0ABV9TDD7_9GAMM|nr:hypothetical protein [Pseudofrancisella aestuarii]